MVAEPRDLSAGREAGDLSPEVRRILQSAAFQTLRRKRNRFSLVLALLMCVIYYGFILTVAFSPKTLGIPVDGVITLGIPVGLGVIALSILLTGVYVLRANGEFDRLKAEALAEASK